ncbi:hypothetical protein LTR95_000939 [Oleoguttula sp. CCFEE 5521]
MTENYKHIPLEFPDKDLRILRLRSGRPGDTITADIIRMDPYNDSSDRQHHDTTFSRLPYEALSWCWGQDGEQGKIKVMDAWQDETKLFDVSMSPSLVEALRSLRYPDKSRDLWIDRICIDQDTVAEREIQVGRMPDVYSNAANVCVWLGIGDESIRAAFELIRGYVLQLQEFDQVTSLAHLSQWDHFIRLSQRPWFSRRWVVQEIALASKATVHCGHEYVDWRDFADAVALLDSVQSAGRRLSAAAKKQPFEEYVDRFSEGIPNLEAVKLVDAVHALFRTSTLTREPQATLEDLIHRLSSFEDFDPKPGDIMPGNVNAAGWNVVRRHKDIFQAGNFEKHAVTYEAQVLKVYAGLVEFVIRNADKGRALDIICRPWATDFTAKDEHPISQTHGFDVDSEQGTSQTKSTSSATGRSVPSSRLPSWIVSVNKAPFQRFRDDTSALAGGKEYQTWTLKRENADGLVGYPDDHVRNYSASGTLGLNVRSFRLLRRQSHYSMFVEGFVLDTLDHVEAVSQLGNIPGDWLKYAKWERRNDDRDHPPDQDAWDTFWKTLVADRDQNGRNAPPFYDRACKMVMRSEPKNNAINTNKLLNLGLGKDRSEVLIRFLKRMQQVIWNRRLIQTKAGRLGLTPNEAQQGDLVCILYGCSVPVVLRRHLNKHIKEDEADDCLKHVGKTAKVLRNAMERRKARLAQKTVEPAAAAAMQQRPGIAIFGVIKGFVSGVADIAGGNLSIGNTGTAHEDQRLPHLLYHVTLFALVFFDYARYRNLPLGELIVPGAVVSLAGLSLYYVCNQASSAIAACMFYGAMDLYPQNQMDAWSRMSLKRTSVLDETTHPWLTPAVDDVLHKEPNVNRGQLGLEPSGTASRLREVPSDSTPGGSTAQDGPKFWYELIGEAYIHNAMNGEAIKWRNEQATEMTTVFEIR